MMLKSIQTFVRFILHRGKDYFDNSSIHGLRYITQPKRHFSERIFWGIICAAAVYATYKLVQATWYNFQYNAVSFVVETSYLEWNTTFPALTICESEAPDKIFDYGGKLFGEDRNMNMDFYLRDITFFDGTCNSCNSHCGSTMNCTEDLQLLVSKVRATCENLMDTCFWNGKPFDCCKYFRPLVTEFGVCYSLNSLHTSRLTEADELKLISNHETGPGKVDLMVYESVKLFIHAPEDVPYLNHPQDEKAVLNWGLEFTLLFQVNEIANDPALSDISVEQRNCRFPDENDFIKTYDYYSYSTCVVNCRAMAQIEYCNCTHHFMPKIDGISTCNIHGLACLTKYSEIFRALRTKESSKKGLVCNCMSSCTEPEYTVVAKTQIRNADIYGSKIAVIMATLPSQRFKRNVVRTRLDLVVSIGGTVGLFLGASILSTAELLYFIFRKRIPHTDEEEVDSPKTETVSVKEPVNNFPSAFQPNKNRISNISSTTNSKYNYPFIY